jgi:hypothetical protein
MGLKPEAASPSTVYRVLAVRRGGGIESGCLARQAGGLLCCRASTFRLCALSLTVQAAYPRLYPRFLSDACSKLSFCDACTIGIRIRISLPNVVNV